MKRAAAFIPVLVAALSGCLAMQVTTSTGRPSGVRADIPRRNIPVTYTDRNQLPYGLAHAEGDSVVLESSDRTPAIETTAEAAQIAFVYSLAAGAWCGLPGGILCPSAADTEQFRMQISFPGILRLPFID